MPFYYSGTSTEFRQLSLAAAIREGLEFDVFVSHKKDDEDRAKLIARCIRLHGLKAWVDVLDPNISADDRELDQKIRDTINNSFSLLAYVSDVTAESWWVPFEIGIAFESEKYLASYTNLRGSPLPLFLSKQPVLKSHDPDLHNWCNDLKRLKAEEEKDDVVRKSMTFSAAKGYSRSSYTTNMQELTNKYRS